MYIMMLKNHHHPYIQSTTVLCDIYSTCRGKQGVFPETVSSPKFCKKKNNKWLFFLLHYSSSSISLSSGPRPQPLVESMGLASSGKLIGKFSSGKFNVGDGSLCSDVKGYVTDDLCVDVCGSVHGVGCVVNGRKVMAVIWVLLLLLQPESVSRFFKVRANVCYWILRVGNKPASMCDNMCTHRGVWGYAPSIFSLITPV